MRVVHDLFLKRKNRSLSAIDENCKKIKKHKLSSEYMHSKNRKKMPPSAEFTMEMKAVKVLVERTKFNEMQFVDKGRSTSKNNLKLLNGGGVAKRGRKRKNLVTRKSAPSSKSNIVGPFKARKCYVKIPKNKVIIRLLANQAKATLQNPLSGEQKRPRGRPKKKHRRRSRQLEATTVVAAAVDVLSASSDANASLKRKHTECGNSPPLKRSRKSKSPKCQEFFIKIGNLTRTSSPRRRINNSTSSEDGKRKSTHPGRKLNTEMNLSALRQKFGSRFFKSYVKVKRVHDVSMVTEVKKKKKNKKNLSVSFLETVEVFGDSSDCEDYMPFDEGVALFSPKGARLKRLENADADVDEDISNSFSSSTPYNSGGSRNNNPSESNNAGKSGGILKRREKISFSPLKEDELSPRKEQLKRANEKIVRLSFKQLPADDDDRETEPKVQLKADKQTSTEEPLDEKDNNCDDEYAQTRPDSIEENARSTPSESEIERITASPLLSEKDDESAELENATNQEQEESLEYEKSLAGTETPDSAKDKEDSECFRSTEGLNNLNEDSDHDQDQEKNRRQSDLSDTLAVAPSDEVQEAFVTDGGEDEYIESAPETPLEETETSPVNDERLQQAEEEISEANQVNISDTSDEHFVDASELVATALLDEQNEADAVLNDVCQIAAAEAAALLSEEDSLEDDVDFSSQPVVADADEVFTSVLTHPEMERSLQSAASTLIPNSQEIVVAAAAASAAKTSSSPDALVSSADDVTEDAFASVVAEVVRFTKDVNPEIYSDDVGITGDDVMMDNVQASNSLDDIFDDDDVDDDIMSSLRLSSGTIDIGHEKSLPIRVIETEVMAIPNEPGLIFDKPLGTTASILGTSMSSTNDPLGRQRNSTTGDSTNRLGRIFQSVKSYVMSPAIDKNSSIED